MIASNGESRGVSERVSQTKTFPRRQSTERIKLALTHDRCEVVIPVPRLSFIGDCNRRKVVNELGLCKATKESDCGEKNGTA